MTSLTDEQVADIGRQIADDLGLPSTAVDLAAFYLGLGLGAALGKTLADQPDLRPEELRAIVREVLARGGLELIQVMRAYASDGPADPQTH